MSIKRSSKSTWGLPPSEGASATVLDPHRRLAAGVLLQATKDAQAGKLGALLWLGDYDCELFLDCLGFEHNRGLRLMSNLLLDDDLELALDTGFIEILDQVEV